MIHRLYEGRRLRITPSFTVAGGTLFVVSPLLVGVAASNIPANTLGSIETDGIFSIPKVTGDGTNWPAGTQVYWDASVSRVTDDDDDGARPRVGLTAEDTTTGATSVAVLLNAS